MKTIMVNKLPKKIGLTIKNTYIHSYNIWSHLLFFDNKICDIHR